jgi:hypothetical protein
MSKITRSRLRLGAAALASATVLGGALAATAGADPLGTQARVSAQGPGSGVGNALYDAEDAAISYNSQRNTYLVVWRGDTNTAGEDEIWARIVGADGTPTGGIVRVSNMGPAGNAAYDATRPKVAYNAAADEHLIVWEADHNAGGLIVNEEEIWGRRISGDGTFAGGQFQISRMGTNGSATYEGFAPDVVYDPDQDQYVVVWHGDQPTPGNSDFEIWGRRLSAGGGSIDPDEVRISDIGPVASGLYQARSAEIAYDPDAKQYLVAFEGDNVNNQFEIFAQRLGQGLGQLGTNDFQISSTPAVGDAFDAEVAYNPVAKRFMAVWRANKIAAGEYEVYGQLLDPSGAQVGTDDFRVSTSGPDGDATYDALQPTVVASERSNEFLAAWRGDDDQPGLVVNEDEIFAQRYTGGGVPVGTPEVRVSTMGPDGNDAYDAFGPVGGAYNSVANEYLLGWEGEDDTGGLVDGELEVYVRRHGAGTATQPFPPNCTPVPARGTPAEVEPPAVITAAYLQTNQRTGSATVRRANAIDEWLNDGIVDRDLCGGSVGPEELHPDLTGTSGPLGPTPPSSNPRSVDIAPAKDKDTTFQASAIQMCINQRIYQTAIARANALKVRLNGRLTGGDITDAELTQGRLRQDLTITAATDTASPPPASKTNVKKPVRRGCDRVRFTTTQAAVNRRIAIQSVVRINEVLDRLSAGLTGKNFDDGSITKADFAPGVTP